MFDSRSSILERLLELGLVGVDELLYGGARVREANGRNTQFVISLHGEPRWCAKTPRGGGDSALRSIWTEATTYWLATRGDFGDVRDAMPPYVDFDSCSSLLITTWLNGSVAWHRGWLSDRQLENVCESLLTLHASVSKSLRGKPAAGLFGSSTPWILTLDESVVGNRAPAAQQFVSELRALGRHRYPLFDLASRWRHDELTHGDIKASNLVVREGDEQHRVAILDWELLSWSCGLWDIAGLAHASIQVVNVRTPIDVSLVISPVFQAYARGRETDISVADYVIMIAARLIQTAFEHVRAFKDNALSVRRLMHVARTMLLNRHEIGDLLLDPK